MIQPSVNYVNLFIFFSFYAVPHLAPKRLRPYSTLDTCIMANIWTAASEGNLERVKECVEQLGDLVRSSLLDEKRLLTTTNTCDIGQSPDAFDDNSYTPLHAAVSWSHTHILLYLLQQGANINITDSDGESPLFVVESAEMARQLVQLGASPELKNNLNQSVSPSTF